MAETGFLCLGPWPVATSSSVSQVEVSPSTVMQLNERSTALGEQGLQDGGRDLGIGPHKGQHGRHVRGDHAGALGDAVEGDFNVADLGGAAGDLSKVSVVMMARAPSFQDRPANP